MGRSVILVLNLTIGWISHVAAMILFVIVLKKDLMGVIWAQMIAFCVYDILCFVMIFKMLKYRQNVVRNLGMPAFSAAMAGLVLLLLGNLLIDRIGELLTILLGIIVYTIVYMVIMIVIRGVKTEELEKVPMGRLFMGLSHRIQHDRYYEE
jgi:hypothetical protein